MKSSDSSTEGLKFAALAWKTCTKAIQSFTKAKIMREQKLYISNERLVRQRRWRKKIKRSKDDY